MQGIVGLGLVVLGGCPAEPVPPCTEFDEIYAFVDADGHVSILDFDTCGEAHYLQDLASFTWSNEYGGRDRRLTDAFLDGYETERPIPAAEAALLPLFVAAKEFRYLCGYATNVNIVGHGPLRYPDLDWFARSIRRHAREAGLL